MRFCLIYDGLYPYTIGGADRWYRSLAESLAELGHEVDVVTPRQWDLCDAPKIPGVRIVAMRPQHFRYTHGRRRILPSILFGTEVLSHLAAHRARYDIVHTASFPYFPIMAAGLVRPLSSYQLFVDWHEVWTKAYWQSYLGQIKGLVGWGVQWTCIRLPHQAIAFSNLHYCRLLASHHRAAAVLLRGQYRGVSPTFQEAGAPRRTIVFAGRFIPEKRIVSLVHAVKLVRSQIPELRCELYGDGPIRDQVEKAVEACGLQGIVRVEGFVDEKSLSDAMASALCFVLPSIREGYGLTAVEAMAHGTPCVVVSASDNAATELISAGINGVIAQDSSPCKLAEAIVSVYRRGDHLRASTSDWFGRNFLSLSFDTSLDTLLRLYSDSLAMSARQRENSTQLSKQ